MLTDNITTDVAKEICAKFQLGNYSSHERIEGGGQHRVYQFRTDSGSFAIKEILNPDKEYDKTEEAARKFHDAGVPAVCAREFEEGRSLCSIGEQNFLVYPWIEGKAINCGDISKEQARQIGAILHQMHEAKVEVEGLSDHRSFKNPEELQEEIDNRKKEFGDTIKAIPDDAPFAKALRTKERDLLSNYEQGIQARNRLMEKGTIFCHSDMNDGNILWDGANPMLIDWEDTHNISKPFSVVKTGFLWCFGDQNYFTEIVDGYKCAGGKLDITDIKDALLATKADELSWMRENVEKYCDPETPQEEKDNCAQEINYIIEHIEEIIPNLESQVPEIQKRESARKWNLHNDNVNQEYRGRN